MTITNADIPELHAALNKVARVRLNSKLTWDMARNARLVKAAFNDIEEARSKLVKAHDKNGDGTINVNDPEWKDFILDLQGVINMPIDIALRPMTLPPEVLAELDAALSIAPVAVAADADAGAIAAANQADASNSIYTLNLKGAFSLLIAEPCDTLAEKQ